jgi:site-specific DNA-methyltransferase (adenine-specific)
MLYKGDCIEIMKKMESKTVDLIFADPPYFLSNGGLSIKNGKTVSVDKGEWDKKNNYEDIHLFTHSWLNECYRLLKPSGTIWITGTYHNIFDIKKQMDIIGYKLLNIVIWHKSDPPPLLYKNKFRFSYEFIIWAKKDSNHFFNYNEMFNYEAKEMCDVWKLPAVGMNEKKAGYHPTQKPECLLERVIKSSSNVGHLVLDPFMGSGTTGYVAKRMNREFIGIEQCEKYFLISKKRLGEH